tara:strand:+ start:62 stop:430 length:369 start_codon:yes stop_codon:yes gene_type:complete
MAIKLKSFQPLERKNFTSHLNPSFFRMRLEFEGYWDVLLEGNFWVESDDFTYIQITRVNHEFEGYFEITISLDEKSLKEEGLVLKDLQEEQLQVLKPFLTRLPRKGDGWGALEKVMNKTFKG